MGGGKGEIKCDGGTGHELAEVRESYIVSARRKGTLIFGELRTSHGRKLRGDNIGTQRGKREIDVGGSSNAHKQDRGKRMCE